MGAQRIFNTSPYRNRGCREQGNRRHRGGGRWPGAAEPCWLLLRQPGTGGCRGTPPARGPGGGAQQPAAMLSSRQPRAPRGWDGGTYGIWGHRALTPSLHYLGTTCPDTASASFGVTASRHRTSASPAGGDALPHGHAAVPGDPSRPPTSPGRAPTGRRGSPVVPPCCLLQWDKPGCCDAVLVELSRDGWYRAWGPRGIVACTASSLPRAAGGENTPGRPGCSHGTDPGSGGSLGGQRGCDPTASSRGEKMRQNKKITLKIHWFPKAEAS